MTTSIPEAANAQHATCEPAAAAQAALAQTIGAPLVRLACQAAGREWQITAVEDQDALLEGVETLERPPYGLMLWESAVALARWLAGCAHLRQARLLELGAGVGLPGLVARWLGAQVCQTDYEPRALALAHYNGQCNGIEGIELLLGDWREWNHDVRYDFIVGADILYERACHPHVAGILDRNLAAGGTVVFADPVRRQALDFVADLERDSWHVELEVEPIRLHPRGREVETAIFVLQRAEG
jgi:predicted nicotinamide N-methyase